MHLVAETFYTLHIRRWEGAQMANEAAALAKLAGDEDLDGFPALKSLFDALEAASGETDPAPIVDEDEVVPVDELEPDPDPEE